MNTYAKAIKWLDETANLGWHLSLDRVTELLRLLGDPQDSLKIVHVAGTNGKGSTVAMMASILKAAGYKTGMYTSPELEDLRDRVLIDGEKISESDFTELMRRTKACCDAMKSHPTQFEILTAAALKHFCDSRCDFVCLEAGLGGRLDATNAVTPRVSVITTVSLDHTDFLGETLQSIATEKAGIIKSDVPVVTGVENEIPLSVIRKRALEHNAPLILVNNTREIRYKDTSFGWRNARMDLRGPNFDYDGLSVGLIGKHQLKNAALAVVSARLLSENRIDIAAIRTGLRDVVWPGRMEIAHERPLVLLDGAHNFAGATALRDAIAEIPRRRLICVLGVLRSHRDICAVIAPVCDELIATEPSSDRALSSYDLAEELAAFGKPVVIESEPSEAIDLALAKASPEDMVLCCGSLYMIGPARTHLRKRLGLSEYATDSE